jgi:SAM-dependent methyltransferase
LEQYHRGGRLPWSPGYSKFKNKLLADALANDELLSRFARGASLPPGYGARIDERVIEIPWTVSRLDSADALILDAGSVWNHALVLDHRLLESRRLFIWSLEFETLRHDPRISYVHGDFRDRVFQEAMFDLVVCISTLEHVGMWSIPKPPFEESVPRLSGDRDFFAYKPVLGEFRRVLRPGGRLLLTVPFGVREDHGWTQIFDADGIEQIKDSFQGDCVAESYYRYRADGWQAAEQSACVDARYFNIVRTPSIEADGAAAARAVACLELRRAS